MFYRKVVVIKHITQDDNIYTVPNETSVIIKHRTQEDNIYTVPNEISVTIKHRTQDDNIYTVPNETSVTFLQFHKNALCIFYIMVKANVNVIMKNLINSSFL